MTNDIRDMNGIPPLYTGPDSGKNKLPAFRRYVQEMMIRPTESGSAHMDKQGPTVQMFIGLDNNAILKDAGTPQKAASRRQEILQELVMETGIAFTMTSDKNNQMKIQAEMTTGQFEAVSEAITKSIVEKQRALEDPSPRVR